MRTREGFGQSVDGELGVLRGRKGDSGEAVSMGLGDLVMDEKEGRAGLRLV